jgi:hypothetical protein
MKRAGSVFLTGLMVVLSAGCGAGRTMVLDVPDRKVVANGVEIVRAESTVDIPVDVLIHFEKELRENLYEKQNEKEAPFVEGSDLRLEYCFIQFDKGNQFSRYMWGGLGNSGEGTMTVQVRYVDNSNEEIAKIQSQGKIGSGFFGGSIKSAVNRCAEEITEYTVTNFR